MRPTNPCLTPAEVEKSVSGRPAKALPPLIWSRFIASQMSDCQQDTVSADLSRSWATCSVPAVWRDVRRLTTLYEEATDEKEKKETRCRRWRRAWC